jgi:hypothetical protein
MEQSWQQKKQADIHLYHDNARHISASLFINEQGKNLDNSAIKFKGSPKLLFYDEFIQSEKPYHPSLASSFGSIP